MPGHYNSNQVVSRCRFTVRWLDHLVSRGEFPSPVWIGSRRWWLAADVEDFLRRRMQGV